MKALIVALPVFIAVGTLLCERARCAQTSEALIVGISGEWKTNAASNEGAKTDGSKDGAGHDRGLIDLGFLQTIQVDKGKTCFYGTGGYLLLQTRETADRLICRPGEDATDCGERVNATMKEPFVCSRHLSQSTTAGESSYVLDRTFPFFHLKGARERYVTPVSRGMDPELKDAVVGLQNEQLDLTPTFEELLSGRYKLRIEPLNGSGAGAASTVAVTWQEGGRAIAAVSGVAAGLYRISRVGENGLPTGQDAWVVVCAPGELAEKARAYGAAVKATKKWPPDVDARAPQAVLRAYLDMLARGTLKEPGR